MVEKPAAAPARPVLKTIPGVFLDIRDLSNDEIDRAIGKATAIGFKQLRTVIPWAMVEPEKNKFTFDSYDHLVRSARSRNMDLILTLGFCPAWAAGEDPDETPEMRMRMMPNRLKDWARYVAAAVSRYKQDVRYWQVWESPSIDNFRGTSRDYVQLLATAHEAIKKIEPDAIVLASEPGGPDLGFIASLFRSSVIRAFEGLALAPQLDTPDQLEEYIGAIRQIMTDRAAAGKRIFITDWGYPISESGKAQSAADSASAAGLRLENAERAQADFALAAFRTAMRLNVDGVIWTALLDSRYLHPEQGKYGLLDDRFSTRPLADALRAFFSAAASDPSSVLYPAEKTAAKSIQGPVCVEFQLGHDVEEGLYTQKFRKRRMANPFTSLQNGVPAAQISDTNPFVYFDVDDRYIFFNQGKSKIEISVMASARDPGREAGFNVMYDSTAGYLFSPWTWIQPKTGWRDYKITLMNANFANKGGFDFRINALGSQQDIYVSKVCVLRLP